MPKRKLTLEEKQEIKVKRYNQERANHPNATVITVDVQDETDENGEARVHVVRMTESEGNAPGS